MVPELSNTIGSSILEGWLWWEWDGVARHINMIRVITTILVIVLCAISWLMKKSTRSIPSLPPGPRGLPLVGNLLSIEPELHRYFAKLSENYGPIMKLKLGTKLCIVISSPTLARHVLKDHDANFANRDPPAVALPFSFGGADILWKSYGHEWRKLRKVFVAELMSKKALDACHTLRRQKVVEMVEEVHGKVGSPINIGELTFLTALKVIMNMLWGASLPGENKSSNGVQIRELVEEIVELLGAPNISDFFPPLARFDLQGLRTKMNKLMHSFDKIFESLIDNQMKAGMVCGEDGNEDNGSKDFLQFLLELKQQGDEASLSLNQIKGLLMDVFVGGTDTTSTTLEWAMAEMLQQSEIMKKACKELEEVVGNENIVEEFHLDKLHYLNAIVKETLRLHPPTPFLIPHNPSVTCTISGYTIPKGSRIILNVWKMQRDSEAWKNPLEFQPDRFQNDSENGYYHGKNFNFLPFGSGRRICAGMPLAEKFLPYLLATLLHSFKWNLPEGTELDLSDKFGLVLKKRKPLLAIPTAKSYKN
ncbi:hypothetical protein Patl1_19944 [Pistacia atlantica]|uniref:Uncharacterized protein n=1 Tax=Pistacia atlantica TaxID=434234 RepID=A0ACC1BI32_9ROSI|nr:hypothetical protein Patl1_19944 [Pistacia atlantica]